MLEHYSGFGYIPVSQKNLEQYYYDWDGNIYYRDDNISKKDGKYHVADGFNLKDLNTALGNGVKLVFVFGTEPMVFSEEELTKR